MILLLTEVPTHAYIDPGTGSLIYQTALALVLGLGFTVRRGRASIVRLLKRLTGRNVSGADKNDRA
jgi:hypothetical protein